MSASHSVSTLLLHLWCKRLNFQRTGDLERSLPASSEQGLTLIECLMAVLLITLTAAMITPPLFLAAATRVQNRQAEQSLQIAQGEIDRIRTLVSAGAHLPIKIPQAVAASYTGANLQSFPPPRKVEDKLDSSSCTSVTRFIPTQNQADADEAIPVDINGDCTPDFLMQVFRTVGSTTRDESGSGLGNRPSEFWVGVRVYSILAASNYPAVQNPGGLTLRTDLQNPPDQASLQLTSGQGNQRTRPLTAVYTRMTWTEDSASLCSYFSPTRQRDINTCNVFP
ncbi:MAG TPA: hypothetical protein V6D10_00885 [Trichocoleus sp.]|jgi:type II secretory pathway pseudopilin PulG